MDASHLKVPAERAALVPLIPAGAGHSALRPFLADPAARVAIASPSLRTVTRASVDHFGHRLVEAMHWRGDFKATALACAVGVNEATISRWKRGGPITLTHAVRLCDTLEVSMDWLIRGLGAAHASQLPDRLQTPPELSARTVEEMQRLLQFFSQRPCG